jgi:hypothetical protein
VFLHCGEGGESCWVVVERGGLEGAVFVEGGLLVIVVVGCVGFGSFVVSAFSSCGSRGGGGEEI